jgi:hypothetical protein
MLRTAKVAVIMKQVSSGVRRWLVAVALLTAAAGTLGSCDTPVGVSPGLQGTYWQNARVTNPIGGGPQVVRWGPPQNYVPGADK